MIRFSKSRLHYHFNWWHW